MGRKKKSSGASEGSSEAGISNKSNGASSKHVVGADFVESNGTVTKDIPAMIAEVQEAVIPAAPVPESVTELTEKNHNFWKSMTQSKISEKGMGLNYVTPVVVNGENVAKLDKKEVDRATESWQNALIVYVIGQNPSLMAIINYCKS